ncbi:MAG: hypothetical protein ACD_73C00026G0002 [uncultured bacterium]|nr:MAG: hypothetical protein ACD_73C00026G0002 [uncultured bacterium]
MYTKKIISVFLFSLTILMLSHLGHAGAPSDILFVLDASGSMEALVSGKTQMDIAKQSIRETLPGIPAEIPVGLRVYAHRIPKTDKENSCKDTELMVPMEAGNAPKIDAAIQALMPKGYTPIAISLRAAAEDFRARESQHVIILLSDGEETCGGDPVAEAKNLIAQGFKVNIHTIGFRVDDKTRAQLKAISDVTGGMYFDASDAVSLTQNLKAATQKALFLEKPREEGRGQEIRGGSQFAEAVKIEKDIEYHLDHHQRVNEYDYFYVDLKKGQLLTTSVMTLGHGVDVTQGNQGQENGRPYNGFKMNDENFKELGNAELIGASHGKQSRTFTSDKDQKVYVLIGSAYDNVHKESPFKVEIADLFDAGSQTDAGDAVNLALEVTATEYPKNYLQNDDNDWFKVPVKAGEVYDVKVLPETAEYSLQMQIMDVNRVQLSRVSSPNAGAVARAENMTIPEDGFMYISVSSYDGGVAKAYSLTIKKKDSVTSPPAVEKIVKEDAKPASKLEAKQEKVKEVAKSSHETSQRFIDKPIVLKIFLGLSIVLNLYLGVMLLIAKFRKKQ